MWIFLMLIWCFKGKRSVLFSVPLRNMFYQEPCCLIIWLNGCIWLSYPLQDPSNTGLILFTSVYKSIIWKVIFVFPARCRSGPAWTALCSCHSSHHELQGSQPWCWPTIGWRVFSGSSQKSQRCPAWQSSWWCGTIRIRVLLRVSRTNSQPNEGSSLLILHNQ